MKIVHFDSFTYISVEEQFSSDRDIDPHGSVLERPR